MQLSVWHMLPEFPFEILSELIEGRDGAGQIPFELMVAPGAVSRFVRQRSEFLRESD